MLSIAIRDFYPGYKTSLNKRSVIGFEVVSDLVAGVFSDTTRERIGIVSDVLTDRFGTPSYYVVDLEVPSYRWQVLLTARRAYADYDNDRVYAAGMTRAEAEQLPQFNAAMRA